MTSAEVVDVKLRWCPACKAPFRTDFARCPTDGTELVQTDEDLLLGETMGQYVLDGLLGEGAMARVYRAHHVHLAHKQFAVKVMIGDRSSTLEMRLRFAQEADAASQLHHPNVISVVDFGKTPGGLLYLAMELVDGRTLAQVIQQEAPLPPRRALELARQIASGLGHAHEQGLVHRDLKPENVLVAGTPEQARIVDFGLAIPADDAANARLTHVGLVVGTPVYGAPEQTHGESVDHRADLFALGVTLYEMLAGVVPFEGGIAAIVRQNASDVMTPIADRSGVRVAPEIETIVRRLMRRDPANRFQSAADVVAAIDRATATTPPASRRRGPLLAGGAAVAVGVLAVGFYATRSEPPKPVVALAPAAPPERASGAPAPQPSSVTATAPAPQPSPVPPVTAAAPAPQPSPVTAAAPAPQPSPVTAETAAAPAPQPSPVTTPSGPTATAAPGPSPQPHATVAPQRVAKPMKTAPVAEAHVEPPTEATAEPPPPVATPEPVTPSPRPPPPEVKPTPQLSTDATATFAGLLVHGPLPESALRDVITRALPAMRRCYHDTVVATRRSPRATARVSVSFDETRRATNIRVNAPAWPAIATCVKSVAEQLRVAVAPDVGTADVTFDIAFEPVTP